MEISFINDTDRNIHISSLTEVANLFRDTETIPPVTVRAVSSDPVLAQADNGEIFIETSAATIQYAVKKCVFMLLNRLTGQYPCWGSLTGVKPLKIMVQLKEKGYDDEAIREHFRYNFMTSEEKIDILFRCLGPHRELLYPEGSDYALYIHVPLCLSKCSYCSFPSAVTPEGSDLCREYLAALIKELKAVTGYFADRTADCVYFGGGTPSILSSDMCGELLDAVRELCPSVKEITYEAGRADTLSEEKFRTLKEGGVTRISLNPQTSNDATLEKINRKASYEDFLASFALARSVGFDNINCDIIFGLEDETEEDCFRSLSDIMATGCESITLHTLCKKRTSALDRDELKEKDLPIGEYMNRACGILAENGYEPYYLYRQKSALDNAENTGYVRKGYGCIYNVRMMGERQTVISAGAGATTKIYFPEEDRFENIYTVKNVRLYIDTIDAVIEKKLAALDRVLNK